MRIAHLYLLFVSTMIFAMENSDQKMTIVTSLHEAQQFANRLVVYTPRKTLGERGALEKVNAQFNYGYIDPIIHYFPDGSTEPKGPAYLRLFVLSYYYTNVITRIISDKTLAQEALMIRLASAAECERVKTMYKTEEFVFQFYRGDFEEDYPLSSRICDANYHLEEIVEKQIEFLSLPKN